MLFSDLQWVRAVFLFTLIITHLMLTLCEWRDGVGHITTALLTSQHRERCLVLCCCCWCKCIWYGGWLSGTFIDFVQYSGCIIIALVRIFSMNLVVFFYSLAKWLQYLFNMSFSSVFILLTPVHFKETRKDLAILCIFFNNVLASSYLLAHGRVTTYLDIIN